MKILFSFIFCVICLSVNAQSNTLTVDISGFNANGQAYIMLYKAGQKFDANSSKCKRHKIWIKNKKATFAFQGLKSGKYAVLVYHDQNKNDKLDTNFIGMPKEGVGVSNNTSGIPSFKKSEFNITGNKEIRISMVYL
jgi:uncharacterized protein (DUF2141 family)